MGRYALAIDAGTTGVRAILFDAAGVARAAAYRELTMRYPRPGWVEQDPDELWQRAREVVAEAVRSVSAAPGEIATVGITNQRGSAVAWDARTLEPLAPMLVWQDVRTADRCRELGEQGFFVTPNTSVTKYEWIAKRVDAARDALAAGALRLGTPDSWLASKLTGGLHATDHSNASATGVYAHFERTWDTALLDAVDLDAAQLPKLVDSSGEFGRTSTEAIGFEAPLAALCGDQQASLFGLGCRERGLTKCSYGTSAMVDVNTADSVTAGGPGTYPLVAWSIAGEVTYCVEGLVVTAGAAVQWLRDGIGILADAAEITPLAASVADSGGAWVVPAFQGLGAPYGLSGARAMIGGLTRGTSRAHIARAFLEGIAQRVADAAECVWAASNTPTALRADGGASANEVLMQLQADLLGLPVECSRERDGAALGAAALAAQATGFWGSGDVDAWRPARVFEPAIAADVREQRREQWKRRLALATQDLV